MNRLLLSCALFAACTAHAADEYMAKTVLEKNREATKERELNWSDLAESARERVATMVMSNCIIRDGAVVQAVSFRRDRTDHGWRPITYFVLREFARPTRAQIEQTLKSTQLQFAGAVSIICPKCLGSRWVEPSRGKIGADICPECEGTGSVKADALYTVVHKAH